MTGGSASDVEVAIATARVGAGIAMASFGRPIGRQAKAGNDFATDADLAAERAMRGVLEQTRATDGIVGEELGIVSGTGRRRWLLDPICGTLNYAAGVPLFAVNVALESDAIVTVAAVAEPTTGTIYATDGIRTFCRRGVQDVPLRPTADTRLVDVNLNRTSSGLDRTRILNDEFHTIYSPRVLSTTLSLAWVAAGRAAAYVCDAEATGSVHFSAGIALCRAAGCVVTALDGSTLRSGVPGFIAAADSPTHAAILRSLPALT